MIGPDADYETKARYLHWLYRRHRPAARWSGNKLVIDQAQQAQQWRLVKAEYSRLFGEGRPRDELGQILVSVWIEARKLAGWVYDSHTQCWRRSNGSPVVDDDGTEWLNL